MPNFYFIGTDTDPTNLANWCDDDGSGAPGSASTGLPTGTDDCFIWSGTCATSNFPYQSLTVVSGATLTENVTGKTVISNAGTIGTNNGEVTSNNSAGTITVNNGPVGGNSGGVIGTNNYDFGDNSGGTITTQTVSMAANAGTVGTLEAALAIASNAGTVTINNGDVTGGSVGTNNGTTTDCTVTNNYGTASGGAVANNKSGGTFQVSGSCPINEAGGTVKSPCTVSTNNGFYEITGGVVTGSGVLKATGTLNIANHTAGTNVTFPASTWW